MRIVALYHPRSEFARKVEEYSRNFQRQQGLKLDLLSLDTREGSSFASIYGIVQYPAIIVLRDDGQMQSMWQGEQLPLMREVAGFATA